MILMLFIKKKYNYADESWEDQLFLIRIDVDDWIKLLICRSERKRSIMGCRSMMVNDD